MKGILIINLIIFLAGIGTAKIGRYVITPKTHKPRVHMLITLGLMLAYNLMIVICFGIIELSKYIK